MLNSKNYKYLVYDDFDKEILSTLINLDQTKIIDFRNFNKFKYLIELFKSFHLFFLNKILIKILFVEGFFITYICSQIVKYNPKIVLTSTDNDLRFYKLKKYFGARIKFMAIQNGLRSKFHDIFDNINYNKSELSADYYFSFGSSIAQYMKKFIDVKVIPVGSFKSNLILKKKYEKKFKKKIKILYISTFRSRKIDQIFEKRPDGKAIYWKDFINSEIKLLKLLNKFCDESNYSLSILGTLRKEHRKEKNFYSKNLIGGYRNFIKKTNKFNNYKVIDNFDIIVTSESTLGYEALGRDKKVAFFKKQITPYNDWQYGWPLNLKNKGLFYSDLISYAEVKRIINNLISTGSSKWKSILIKEKRANMIYDYKNCKLKKYLNYEKN